MGQSCDCLDGYGATLNNGWLIPIKQPRMKYNHNKRKLKKTVCIFYGMNYKPVTFPKAFHYKIAHPPLLLWSVPQDMVWYIQFISENMHRVLLCIVFVWYVIKNGKPISVHIVRILLSAETSQTPNVIKMIFSYCVVMLLNLKFKCCEIRSALPMLTISEILHCIILYLSIETGFFVTFSAQAWRPSH